MTGKDKCNMLRELRRQIAAENDISYITEDCKFKGSCKGTCPKCEAEVRYLENELEKRRAGKKRVALATVSVGAMLAMTGCNAIDAVKTVVNIIKPTPEIEVLDGEVPQIEALEGEVEYIPDDYSEEELSGAVADE